jgi:hypothetical protein
MGGERVPPPALRFCETMDSIAMMIGRFQPPKEVTGIQPGVEPSATPGWQVNNNGVNP